MQEFLHNLFPDDLAVSLGGQLGIEAWCGSGWCPVDLILLEKLERVVFVCLNSQAGKLHSSLTQHPIEYKSTDLPHEHIHRYPEHCLSGNWFFLPVIECALNTEPWGHTV